MLGSFSSKDLSTSSNDIILMFTFSLPSVKVWQKTQTSRRKGMKRTDGRARGGKQTNNMNYRREMRKIRQKLIVKKKKKKNR